jgi:hypothetical protein
MNIRRLTVLAGLGLLAALFSCSSDPEGPVSQKFVDGGSLGVKGGGSFKAIIPVEATTVRVPLGVGTRPLLGLGELRGVRFQAVLLRFSLKLSHADSLKTVASAQLHLPVQVASPADFAVKVTFNELAEDFNDADTIAAIPQFNPVPVADSLGATVRDLTVESLNFSLDTSIVAGWLTRGRPSHGVAVMLAAPPDTSGLIEMNAHERGTDPPALHVQFTDGTDTSFATVADYTVVLFTEGGLNCLGGVAQRIKFTFDLGTLPARAMVNASFLVLKTRGDQGVGATTGEVLLLGRTQDFSYHLYAPGSPDTLSAAFLTGTGVDLASFDPLASATVRMQLRGYTSDVLRGARTNNGLVLGSDLETSRVQKASFAAGGDDAPHLEVFYTLPAVFKGKP